MLKIVFRVSVALFISLLLTVLCVAFIPSFFKATLTSVFDVLPNHQFVEHEIKTKQELIHELDLPEITLSDELNFKIMRKYLPDNRDKSVFFARMFVVHDYPERCQYQVIGMHRTLDLAWQVTGLRCGDKKSCFEALEYQICRDKKEPKHARHD